jgi:copper homeostasis protein
VLLEVIVLSVADALAATSGGADRLEVVREIDRDGLTPSLDLVRAIADASPLPLRVMVRESDGFGVSSPREITALQRTVEQLAKLAVDGAVLGFTRGGDVDVNTTRAVLSAAPDLCVTFHRAFDAVRDQSATLTALRQLPQVDRILTSGGDGPWATRSATLARLGAKAGESMAVMAGGGIDAGGLQILIAARCVREVHVGRAARNPPSRSAPVSAERVRELRQIADRFRR